MQIYRHITARLAAMFNDQQGQSTLEYALVFCAVLAIVVACGALWRAAQQGSFVEAAVQASSHSFQLGGMLGGIQDVLLY